MSIQLILLTLSFIENIMTESVFIELLQQSPPSFYWILLAFFMGLLTSLSTCLYPLLPITIATLSQNSTSSVTLRALLYCLGLSSVYAILGATAALSGQFFGSIASHPFTQIIFANLLLLFAFVLKGWIPLPTFLYAFSQKQHSHSALLMGVASGFVAAPCSSPILAAILLFVAEQQNITWGIAILFSFAVGMCLLLFLAGIFSGFIAKIPKSGRWLNIIQWFMFVLLLIMSQYYLLRAGQLIYI
ncbi:cytochrome c biogenesis protein CcdA [Pseudoalteromonas aurantia]|uniref:Thiol:disulfide interchange protein n=1 Tax=Pseudoalteromonas aurantia TaxID=43654 RepID=A0ABY2VTM9_9GAMM|nr:cytochrome c biogenesis protein CcdA [Pseudoalteromonas aurantia]TMO71330.1 thiol:disulfide interchange protein [Pseudoalteromonas aurantia]